MLLCYSLQGSFAFGASWKVLVYMQADNNLEQYAYWDLAEMELVQNSHVPVFVELDLPGNSGIKRLKVQANPNPQDLNAIDFSNYSLDKLNSIVIDEFAESELQQDGRLLKFLLEMEKLYPTDHTMLVIWGHGEGFSTNQLAQFGGVALDNYPQRSKLSIEAIRNVIGVYNNLYQKQIEILAMDACLMQTLEVAIEMREKVQYLVGSTQIQDFRGLPYDTVLQFMQVEELTPHILAKKIPELFEKRARENFKYDKRTISAINIAELKYEVLPALNQLAKALNEYLDGNLFHKMAFLTELTRLPFFLGESRDLSSMLSHFESYYVKNNVYSLAQEIAKVRYKLNKANMAYYYGDYYIYEYRLNLGSFKAFGVWMPGTIEDYQTRVGQFKYSEIFYIMPNWKKFYDTLYAREIGPYKLFY